MYKQVAAKPSKPLRDAANVVAIIANRRQTPQNHRRHLGPWSNSTHSAKGMHANAPIVNLLESPAT
jgi:hypothetical protein